MEMKCSRCGKKMYLKNIGYVSRGGVNEARLNFYECSNCGNSTVDYVRIEE